MLMVDKTKKHTRNMVSMAIVAVLSGCGVKDDLVGKWRCQTANPNQSFTSDEFTFGKDSQLSALSDSMLMLGKYTVQGKKVEMNITEIPGLAAYGYSTHANQAIHGEVKLIASTEMVLETYTKSSAVRRVSTCRRSK